MFLFRRGIRLFLVLTILIAGAVVVARYFGASYSANLLSVSVTTTNSRPSFRGALGAGNTVGTSKVILNVLANNTAGSYPSSSSAQLVEGDTVAIGNGPTMSNYTIASTSAINATSVQNALWLTSVLLSGHADAGDDVISTKSANLNIRFQTVSAITDGSFRVLIPAGAGGAASADGIPDGGTFDYGATTPSVTCPNDITNYDFTTGTSSPHAVTINGISYHSYTCAYTGNGAVGTNFDGGLTNGMMTINNVINPAPLSGHIAGVADTYGIILEHLDSGGNAIDATPVKIALVEAVKVTASVAPQITFKIMGVNVGTSVCGVTTDVTTTATNVPFGDIIIGTFTDAAQGLSVSTNASGGYVVTAAENDQLGKNGAACTGDPTAPIGSGGFNPNCIQDVRGDTPLASHTASDEWNNSALADNSGFGYSLQDANSTVNEVFAYNESGRSFSARRFADLEASESPTQIFSDSSVASNDNIYVCYRIMPDATTVAGNYENYITYTATATF